MRGVELAKELGVTYRQIHHWTTQGHVLPLGGTLPQGGVALEFNAKEVRVLRIMAAFVQYGMKPSVAAYFARQRVEDNAPVTIFDLDGIGRLVITA